MALGLAETARLAVRIDLEGNISKGIKGLQGQVRGLDSSLGRIGKGAGQIGAGFARAGLAVGGAAVLGLGAAAKAAIDFEDAFAGVRKTVDEADLRAAGLTFEELEKSFREMATEIPIAATEFARLGETAGALGVKAQDIDEFVKTTALLGVTTNLTADEAADAFGRIGTILGLTGDDYEELADSIVALGNAGASTESEITEITKRFAAQAKQAGLTKEEMVGLASVTASLGFEPERGGTALARVFANMSTNIALANKKGKAFSKLVGEPIIELQRKIDQGKGLEIFQDVLQEIKGLSPTEANRTLKALGITNQSDRSIFIAMADQLPEVNRQLGIAKDATGALGEEAQKRFNTVASKIAVFKNNLIEAGITIGEGMLEPLGRATEKLTAFLKQDATKSELTNIGKEIGEAIDGIDWDEVLKGAKEMVGVLKSALSFAKQLFDIFNSLPTEVKGALGGGVALDKLSGGLLHQGAGNLLGGAVQGLAARAPGVGKLFAQPVFVTNWPIGFGAGGKGGGGGLLGGGGGKLGMLKGLIRGVGTLATFAVIPLVEEAIRSFGAINERSTAQGQQAHTNLNNMLAGNPELKDMQTSLRAVNDGINNIQANPLLVALSGDSLNELRTMREELQKGIVAKQAPANAEASQKSIAARENSGAVSQTELRKVQEKQNATNLAIKNAQSIASRENSAQKTEIANTKNAIVTQGQQTQANQRAQIVGQAAGQVLDSVHAAGQAIRDATQQGATKTAGTTAANASRSAGNQTSAAMDGAAGRIVRAIWAARPIIQSTNVVNNYTRTERSGSTGDSRTRSGV